jgi:hypothetical protein
MNIQNGDRYYDNGKIKIGIYHDSYKPLTDVSPDMELLQKAILNLPRYSDFWEVFWDSLHWALSFCLFMFIVAAWLGLA